MNKDGSFTVNASNVTNASTVLFPTWNPQNGQDDIVWYPGTDVGGGVWRATVLESAHRDSGSNQIWIHAYSSNPSYPPSGSTYCGAASTLIPCTYTIQGRKREWNGSTYVDSTLASAQTVTLSGTGGGSTSGSTFTYGNLTDVSAATRTLTATRPSGCTVGYSMCLDDTNCHGTVQNSGNGFSCTANSCSLTVDADAVKSAFDTEVDPYAYADVYFHYTCTPACTSITSTALPTTTAITGQIPFTVNGISGGVTAVKIRATGASGTVTYNATQVVGDPTKYTADINMQDTTLFADPLTITALITNASNTDFAGCSTTLNRKVNLTGRIYNTNGAATSTNAQGVCSAPLPAAQFSPTGGATCSYTGGGTCTVSGANVSVTNASLTSSARILSLTADPVTYSYSCPANGQQSATPSNFTQTYNFYLTQNAGAWYQMIGGNARAESGAAPAIRSIIPDSCAGCTFSRKAVSGATGNTTSGYTVVGSTGTSISAAGAASSSKLNEEGNNGYAQGDNTAGQQNYAYFYNLFDLGASPTAPITTNSLTLANLDVNNATYVATHAYYVRPSSGNTVTIASGMTVPAGRSIVVFVNGDLVISGATPITVSNNSGFLAFIVNGSITFANDVGTATLTSETPTIEGVYIANTTLNVATTGNTATERKFIGAGTFAGFGGISLNRSLGATNNTQPAELFIARPDFALHAPTELKRAIYDWQEIEP